MALDISKIKALAFDVFGTTVDWFTTITRECSKLAETKGISGVDWREFAVSWRNGYRSKLGSVTSGERPWTTMDVLVRELLDGVIEEFSINGLTSADRDDLNDKWQSLDGWPDSSPGLSQLGNKFLLAALSNGSIDMLENISKNANLPWNYVISTEMFGTYKPDPKVYLGACSVLELPPESIMMVAAHKYDLEAAKAQGMQTAFIMRLEEFGSLRDFDVAGESFIDVYAYDFHQLATKLGA